MPRLVFIVLMLAAGAAVAAPATGLKNPFATISESTTSAESATAPPPSAADAGHGLKDPWADAGPGSTTDLKDPWDRPGEPRDPFAARSTAEPSAPPIAGPAGVRQPAAAPIGENVHGLVDPWARPPTQRPASSVPAPAAASDLKNPFEPAPAGNTGLVDPWAPRPPTQRPRPPSAH